MSQWVVLQKQGFQSTTEFQSQANEDGFSLKAVLLYGGTITTPDGKTIIVMEYTQHTLSWRLPLPSNKRFSKPKLLPRVTSEKFVDLRSTGSSIFNPSNPFQMLDETRVNDVDDEGYVPDYLTQDRIEGRFQQRYELMLKRREMAGIYHTSHCNNHQTVLNLQAKGIECNYLKRYILAHRCDACDAAPSRRHHKVKATKKAKRKAKSILKTAAPVATVIAPAFDSQNPLAEHH